MGRDLEKKRECQRRYYQRHKKEISESQKEWHKKHAEQHNAYSKQYYADNVEKCRQTRKDYWRKQKQLVLDQYGSICQCCGENRIEFLTIDHINGGGHGHRKSLKKRGKNFLFWLIQNNFPEGFQVLCMNCNFSKGLFGYCPHEKERELPCLQV